MNDFRKSMISVLKQFSPPKASAGNHQEANESMISFLNEASIAVAAEPLTKEDAATNGLSGRDRIQSVNVGNLIHLDDRFTEEPSFTSEMTARPVEFINVSSPAAPTMPSNSYLVASDKPAIKKGPVKTNISNLPSSDSNQKFESILSVC